MDLNLKGRVAVVTGGSRGIGRAVVERLADAGVNVVINFHRNEQAAFEVSRYAENAGVRGLTISGDISRLEESERLIDVTIQEFGKIDLLICNAGIWEGASVEKITEEQWDRVLDINLRGTWSVCRAAVPHMKNRGWGRIVIVSSTAGQRGESNVSNYAASKGGQISFAKSLATELAEFGINVNTVAPGWVETEMNSEVFADEEYRQKIAHGIPLGRIASADDVALPILFLCSDWARHITGEVLNVNGGSVLCG